jgi:hypothetical protein
MRHMVTKILILVAHLSGRIQQWTLERLYAMKVAETLCIGDAAPARNSTPCVSKPAR